MSVRLAWVSAAALPALAFLHALSATWLRWGDLVVDCGRELDTALQLSQGRLLYVDVRCYYGPLAPYVNAALFRCFGVRAEVLMTAGAVSAALMTWLLYRLARQFTGRLAASLTATAFVYLCGFGHIYVAGIFNFVFPYAYAATYGMLLATASLLFLVRYSRKERPRDFVLAVAALALAALTKVEVLFPAALIHLLFLGALLTRRLSAWVPRSKPAVWFAPCWTGKARSNQTADCSLAPLHGLSYGLALLAVAAIYGFFWSKIGSRLLTDNLLTTGNAQAWTFFAHHMGFADLAESGAAWGYSAAALAGTVVMTWLLSRIFQRRSPATEMAALVSTAFCAAAIYYWVPVLAPLRVLPLMAALTLILLASKRAAELKSRFAHLILWVFVLGCLCRIPLKAGAFHYGFYLIPVGLVGFAAFWFEYLPLALQRGRKLCVAAGAAVLLTLTFAHWRESARVYALHTDELVAPRGHMRLLAPTGKWYAETIRVLRSFSPETKVLVIPQGAGLTFFSERRNPYSFHTLSPIDLCGSFDESGILKRLRSDPPDVIVLLKADAAEFGARGFGLDYGLDIATWIEREYQLYGSVGPDGFVTMALRRPQ
jgi:hypothetical protein